MAYNQNLPQATDAISDSQSGILGNFQAIKTLVDVNHVTFDDPSGNQGMHKFLQMPDLAANIGTTDGSGDFSGSASAVTYAIGQYFSIGTTTFTIASVAAGPQALTSTGSATGTFNATNGAVVITGNGENPSSNVYFVPITIATDQGALYVIEGANSAGPELTFRRENNGEPIAFTEGSLGISFASGWSRFPSGLIMKWGRETGSASYSVDLTIIGPQFSAVYGAQVTPASSVTAYAGTLTTSALAITASASATVYWQVIGK